MQTLQANKQAKQHQEELSPLAPEVQTLACYDCITGQIPLD